MDMEADSKGATRGSIVCVFYPPACRAAQLGDDRRDALSPMAGSVLWSPQCRAARHVATLVRQEWWLAAQGIASSQQQQRPLWASLRACTCHPYGVANVLTGPLYSRVSLAPKDH